jgi:hypothetical protein
MFASGRRVRHLSFWRRTRGGAGRASGGTEAWRLLASLAMVAGLAGAPVALPGQTAPDPGRVLAVETVRAIQARTGIALWGGNPVPGTASTLGMRIGSTPRLSVSGRAVLVPAELPPLLDRSDTRGQRTTIPGLSAQAAVGVLQGFSPAPTVGGVLSVDVIGRVAVAPLAGGAGFDSGAALGWSGGVRVGLLRESFTLPGVSLTGSYGRSSRITFGDPELLETDGFVRGTVSDLNATLAASQRVGPVRLSAGVAGDRYRTEADLGTRSAGAPVSDRARITTDRRSWFANAAWTFLVFHASTELGWQELPDKPELPNGARLDPVGWWAGIAFRVSI